MDWTSPVSVIISLILKYAERLTALCLIWYECYAFLQVPLTVTLPSPEPLTSAMFLFLQSIKEPGKGPVSPKILFNQLCQKYVYTVVICNYTLWKSLKALCNSKSKLILLIGTERQAVSSLSFKPKWLVGSLLSGLIFFLKLRTGWTVHWLLFKPCLIMLNGWVAQSGACQAVGCLSGASVILTQVLWLYQTCGFAYEYMCIQLTWQFILAYTHKHTQTHQPLWMHTHNFTALG